jgi:hypothetical protein
MNIDSPSPPIFPTDNDQANIDTDIMRSYAIDTLFASEYYSRDTEEIETIDALCAPDREQFITAIQKEFHTLIDETGTLVPPKTRPTNAHGKSERPSNASAKRKRMENRTSTRPEAPHAEIPSAAP